MSAHDAAVLWWVEHYLPRLIGCEARRPLVMALRERMPECHPAAIRRALAEMGLNPFQSKEKSR
jgi:hypothetical protein